MNSYFSSFYWMQDITRCLLWVQQRKKTWPIADTDPLRDPLDFQTLEKLKETHCVLFVNTCLLFYSFQCSFQRKVGRFMPFFSKICLSKKNDFCSDWAHPIKPYFVQEGEQHSTADVRCRMAGEPTRVYTILLSSLNVCTKSLLPFFLLLLCRSVLICQVLAL